MNPPVVANEAIGRWSVPKPGNQATENEDSYHVGHGSDGSILMTVSDGASTTVYSRSWAELLVRRSNAGWFALSDEEIASEIAAIRAEFGREERPTKPWYVARRFAQDGSQATFLSVRIRPTPTGAQVDALAVGDSVVIVIAPDGAFKSFPVGNSGQFSTTPDLVGSPADQPIHFQRWKARVKAGSVVLAGTDAVGQCLLTALEAGHGAQVLDLANRHGDELDLAAALTTLADLREDDLTLVAYRIPDPKRDVDHSRGPLIIRLLAGLLRLGCRTVIRARHGMAAEK